MSYTVLPNDVRVIAYIKEHPGLDTKALYPALKLSRHSFQDITRRLADNGYLRIINRPCGQATTRFFYYTTDVPLSTTVEQIERARRERKRVSQALGRPLASRPTVEVAQGQLPPQIAAIVAGGIVALCRQMVGGTP